MKHKSHKIVLFRFHDKFSICKNKLEVIKHYNPGIQIYGLFGGETKNLSRAKRILGGLLDHIYQIPVTDSEWKWQNGDLSLIDWFKNFGNTIAFETLFLIEWDLIHLGSLEELYKHVPRDGVGLTGLISMEDIPKWRWINKEPWKSQWLALLDHVKKEYDYRGNPQGCLGPGNVFPRAFIEKYSKIDVPVLCHEEIRFPLFAQVFGFKLYDNGFFKDWHNRQDDLFFSCAHDKKEIRKTVMNDEMRKMCGRRVFHPFIKIFKLNSSEIIAIPSPLSGKLIPDIAKRF